MKRSEAIDLAVKIIKRHLDYHGVSLDNTGIEAAAEDVVAGLEGLGMLAPARKIEGQTEFSFWSNTWEDKKQ